MKAMQRLPAILLCAALSLTFGCAAGQKPGVVTLDNAMPKATEFTSAGVVGCSFGHEGKPGSAEAVLLAGTVTTLICPILSVAMVGASAAMRSKAANGTNAKYSNDLSEFDKESLAAIDVALKNLMRDKYIATSELKPQTESQASAGTADANRNLVAENNLDYAIIPKFYYTVASGGINPSPALVIDWSVMDKNMNEKWRIKTTVSNPVPEDKTKRVKIKNTSDPENAAIYAELAAKSAEDFWVMWNGGSPVHSKQIVR